LPHAGPIGGLFAEQCCSEGASPITPGTIELPAKLAPPAAVKAGILGVGWSDPEPDGVWSLGHTATIAGRFATLPTKPVTLTIRGYGFTGRPGDTQRVTVSISGHPLATWLVSTDSVPAYAATFEPALLASGTAAVSLRDCKP